MKSDLAANVFTVSGLLAVEECQSLIARAEALGFERAIVHTAAGRELRREIRDNDRIEFVDSELAVSLWERCREYVPREFEGGEAVGLDERFRFYRYDVGQRFKRHKDGTATRSPEVRSRLSCLFYLNDGFAGGETVFFADESLAGVRAEVAVMAPRAGDALFFVHERWHEGRALQTGRKYVLRSDVFYRFE